MSREDRALRRLAAGAACVAALCLGGCTGMGGAKTAPDPAASTETRDRITASDEPESAKRARVRMELASAYFSRGQLTTALDEVKLAIAADPTNASAFNLRGLIYASLGDEQLAEESFRRALQLDARNADAMQNYGWYLCQRRRYAEADTMFRQALAVPQYRDSPRTLLTQGICQARGGNLPQAEATLMRSYELDPTNPVTAVNLAEVLYRRGEFERARFQIRRVNGNADIANAQTLWLAARIENRLGNRQGVQDFGSQLRNRFPQSPEAGAFARGQFDE
jgi:type IV pilus assembly protein PilF